MTLETQRKTHNSHLCDHKAYLERVREDRCPQGSQTAQEKVRIKTHINSGDGGDGALVIANQ